MYVLICSSFFAYTCIHTHLCDNDNDKAIIMITMDANPKSSAKK